MRINGSGMIGKAKETASNPSVIRLDEERSLKDLLPSHEHISLVESLANAVNAMRGRKREIFQLYLQNKTQDEIGIILSMSRRTVRTYWKRGVKELRKLLSE